MKYAVGAIVLMSAAVLGFSLLVFDARTVEVMAVAMAIVTIFGGAPVLFSVVTRRREPRPTGGAEPEIVRIRAVRPDDRTGS